MSITGYNHPLFFIFLYDSLTQQRPCRQAHGPSWNRGTLKAGLACHFDKNRNIMIQQPPIHRGRAWRRKCAAKTKKFPVRLRSPAAKRGLVPNREFLIWQRVKDSNPHKRSQSPVCYHYTNPLYRRPWQTHELLYYIFYSCQDISLRKFKNRHKARPGESPGRGGLICGIYLSK